MQITLSADRKRSKEMKGAAARYCKQAEFVPVLFTMAGPLENNPE